MVIMRIKKTVHVIVILFLNHFSVYCFEPADDCRGNCVSGASSKNYLYNFYVTDNTGQKIVCNGQDDHCHYKLNPGFFINGKSPGPTIEICLGDTVEVMVHNKLKSQELSFHWNGIHQESSVHMDGVSMVTQCPILPFTSFRYHLKPSKPGTFFYHAHSVMQQGDGLFGSLTVRGPGEDLALMKILMISARTSRLLSLNHVEPPEAIELLINGQRQEDIKVEQNRKYHFRLINANALNCPILFSVAHHNLKIISVDSNPVNHDVGKRVILFPGERVDVEVETSRTPGKYAISLVGVNDCRNLLLEWNLVYENVKFNGEEVIRASEDYLELPQVIQGHKCEALGKGTLCLMDMRALESQKMKERPGQTFFVNFDQVFYDIEDSATDYKFNIYEFIYYPSYLSVSPAGTKIPQINGVSFKYPPSPILSQSDAVYDDILCDLDYKSRECSDRPLFCECLQVLEVPSMENIDVILINEGKGGNNSYVFHLHGYSAFILGVDKFDRPISKSEIMSLNTLGKLKRNLLSSVKRDTFVVPNKGYVILRLFTDNFGYWLWESRTTGVSPATNGPGLQFLMLVGTRESLPTVPLDFPVCGNHKGPDLIFQDE